LRRQYKLNQNSPPAPLADYFDLCYKKENLSTMTTKHQKAKKAEKNRQVKNFCILVYKQTGEMTGLLKRGMSREDIRKLK